MSQNLPYKRRSNENNRCVLLGLPREKISLWTLLESSTSNRRVSYHNWIILSSINWRMTTGWSGDPERRIKLFAVVAQLVEQLTWNQPTCKKACGFKSFLRRLSESLILARCFHSWKSLVCIFSICGNTRVSKTIEQGSSPWGCV